MNFSIELLSFIIALPITYELIPILERKGFIPTKKTFFINSTIRRRLRVINTFIIVWFSLLTAMWLFV